MCRNNNNKSWKIYRKTVRLLWWFFCRYFYRFCFVFATQSAVNALYRNLCENVRVSVFCVSLIIFVHATYSWWEHFIGIFFCVSIRTAFFFLTSLKISQKYRTVFLNRTDHCDHCHGCVNLWDKDARVLILQICQCFLKLFCFLSLFDREKNVFWWFFFYNRMFTYVIA